MKPNKLLLFMDGLLLCAKDHKAQIEDKLVDAIECAVVLGAFVSPFYIVGILFKLLGIEVY